MREGKPSKTAVWVAWGRGMYGKLRDAVVDDPVAERLVPEPYKSLIALARRSPAFTGAFEKVVAVVSGGRSRHMPLRTRAIDDALIDAVSRGAEQLVILGAGLDARAWRLDALANVVVFEADHPTMQAYKRSQIAQEIPRAREVRYVAVDLERDDLATILDRAGHDRSRPTAFIWEGVTMYLTREAIDATLTAMRDRSAPRSTAIVTYFERGTRSRIEVALLRVLSIIGEPIMSAFSPSEMASVLARHDFSVRSDEGDAEWAPRYFGHPERASMERLVVATRDA
jgi:methyltransferase (TIGR00027 family)